MNGQWWPAAAPYPRRPMDHYTTHELNALLRWTAGQLGNPRVAEINGMLTAERSERDEYAARMAAEAAAGLPGIPPLRQQR